MPIALQERTESFSLKWILYRWSISQVKSVSLFKWDKRTTFSLIHLMCSKWKCAKSSMCTVSMVVCGIWPKRVEYSIYLVLPFERCPLYRRKCVWMCMSVSSCVCLCLCVCICVCVHVCICMCTCMCPCVYLHEQPCSNAHTWDTDSWDWWSL